MALPDPSNQMRQYQPRSNREAIGTHTSAALLQMQINMLSKSPLLRMIPGSGILKERAELKKRERYEKTGRDESGRKLTKDEFEDREKRRKDLGALASIQEMLQKLLIDKKLFVPVQIMDSKKDMTGGGQPVINPSEEGAYSLAGEEAAVEKERADDADDDKTSKRQEGFFSKLFGFGGKKKGEGGGILGALMSLLSPLLNLFSGGLSGLVGTLITPILAAIGGALTAISSALTPLLMTMAPLILPLLVAAGLGYLVKGKIESETEAMDEASKREGARGVQMKNVDGIEVPIETINGRETGRLHTEFATPRQAAAFKKARDGVNPNLPQSTLTPGKKQLKTDFEQLDGMMDAFTQDLRSRAGDLDNPGTGEKLATQWNAVKKYAENMMMRQTNNGMGDQASDYLSKLCSSYGPFERMFRGGSFVSGDAEYVVTGGLDKNQLILPTGWLDMARTSTTSAGLPFLRVLAPSEAMNSETDISEILRQPSNGPGISVPVSPPNIPEGVKPPNTQLQGANNNVNIKNLSDIANALRDMNGMASPTIIAPTTNTVAQTNTAISSGGPSARQQTGAERSVNFSGGMAFA